MHDYCNIPALVVFSKLDFVVVSAAVVPVDVSQVGQSWTVESVSKVVLSVVISLEVLFCSRLFLEVLVSVGSVGKPLDNMSRVVVESTVEPSPGVDSCGEEFLDNASVTIQTI